MVLCGPRWKGKKFPRAYIPLQICATMGRAGFIMYGRRDMKSGNAVAKSSVNTLSWSLALFGTAVGAGVLFLPIQVGQGGFWPLLLVAVLVFPTIYFAHSYYGLIPDRSAESVDYATAVSRLLPRGFGTCLSFSYIGWLLILLVAYSISLTNDAGDFLAGRQWLSATAAHRFWLSFFIVCPLLLLLRFARRLLVRILGGMTVLLIVLLCLVSIALIPHWQWSVFAAAMTLPTPYTLLKQFLLLFPLLVLSFMFFPILASLVQHLRSRIPEPDARQKSLRRIIMLAVVLLMTFLLIFVLSFMLALPKTAFADAAQKNISALALLGNIYEGSWLGDLGPAISMTALFTSFLGIFIGYREALLPYWIRLFRRVAGDRQETVAEHILFALTFALLWGAAIANIAVMDILGDLVAPLGAVFLLLVPAGIILRVESFKTDRSPYVSFVFAAGILVVAAYFIGTSL